MLKNYLAVAIRNLWRNKTVSFIHITGLRILSVSSSSRMSSPYPSHGGLSINGCRTSPIALPSNGGSSL